MGWRDWSGWLKGGILLSLLDLIFLIFVVFPAFQRYGFGDFDNIGWLIFNLPLSLVFSGLFSSPFGTLDLTFFVIISLANWFLIGAVIGWIIGKFRK